MYLAMRRINAGGGGVKVRGTLLHPTSGMKVDPTSGMKVDLTLH